MHSGGNIENVIIKILPTFQDIITAVKGGTVDLVFGLDTIGPNDFRDLHKVDDDNLSTYISGPISTRAVLLNSAKPPLNSLAVRRALMHAVNKQVRFRNMVYVSETLICVCDKCDIGFDHQYLVS